MEISDAHFRSNKIIFNHQSIRNKNMSSDVCQIQNIKIRVFMKSNIQLPVMISWNDQMIHSDNLKFQ